MQTGKTIFGAAVLALMVGCTGSPSTEQAADPPAPPPPPPPPEVEDRSAPDTTAQGTGPSGTTGILADAEDVEGVPLTADDGSKLTLVIYFDFDSSEVHPDDRIVVEAHAQYLHRVANAEVVLEGHADERGSREYNVALGERRANGVRDMLRVLGVADHQIRTVSYGEERPAVSGHEEESWSLNRRVEFAYAGR